MVSGTLLAIAILSFLSILFPASSAYFNKQTDPASNSNNNSKCDATLWKHVYNPTRLQVISKCKSVSGIVTSIRGEKDGDYHIQLKLDEKYAGLINEANVRLQGGNLVLEPICEKLPVTQKSALGACIGFHGADLRIPYVGEHVNVTGSYVLDHGHQNWAEIHPITSLNVMP